MSNKRKSVYFPTHSSRCNQFTSLNSAACDRRAVLNLTAASASLTTFMTYGRLASVLSTAVGGKKNNKIVGWVMLSSEHQTMARGAENGCPAVQSTAFKNKCNAYHCRQINCKSSKGGSVLFQRFQT